MMISLIYSVFVGMRRLNKIEQDLYESELRALHVAGDGSPRLWTTLLTYNLIRTEYRIGAIHLTLLVKAIKRGLVRVTMNDGSKYDIPSLEFCSVGNIAAYVLLKSDDGKHTPPSFSIGLYGPD